MAKKKAEPAKAPDTDILGRKVDRKEFERHLALAHELGLTAGDLEEEVNTALEHIASMLNDKGEGGLESQIAFLLIESGPLLEEELRDLAEFKGPKS